ncbi:hypothetical protein CO033_01775 [Candidatus Nomurabacteria bacterium CG_4_9_14_0_2_um_filter_32_10]|uniref:Uncharacterized protein n=3 Tax=Candidatus Nomuraibacteriota TaxID=1752729 RepID=A0A2H0CHP1_9BACT|nr:MAG: hypothetical protein COW91_02645 [Candidatus Nomurabacteria bacterium CG22_combo_CG10-13_8_21_14_all_32_8]PIZ86170.1 MAG: hypothetical protein COX94_00945 [Candidatus Nomurabacteria bacterium CG_4_10_14_0_2_um_filter_33_9]PJC49397.1 MAG: hypothetical protein CO033_01775 [Candidatus Nomurabacteria bacterium CG_4_9_14_0_2_um_filter_32_10]
MEIKFLKKKKKFTKGGLRIKPDLYWRYILYVTFILISLSFVFGFFLFRKINNQLVSPISNLDGQEIIDKGRINKILKFFKGRENKSIEILNSTSPIVDPSL